MSDRDRIRALVEEGRISSDEAERLIATLDEIDEVERVLPEPIVQPVAPAAVGQAEAKIAAVTGSATAGETQAVGTEPAPRSLQDGGGWVVVDGLAGEVKVTVDCSVGEPVLVGDEGVRLEREGSYYCVSQLGGGSGGLVDRLVGGFRRSSLRLKIPKDYGLELKMKTGQVQVCGELSYLKGSILAGEVDVEAARGVDLSLSAGELNLGLRLLEGKHRVRTSVGEVNLTLLSGSSVRAEGRSSIGDVRVGSRFEKEAQGIGHSFKGQIGSGDADLSVRVSTGAVKVKVEDE
ncbi:MAG: DUF4097 family beta strand repeat-containing protein [Truepera sp.]|nr:DUF4097 family beta strand repeat-containing protein [Truepera sp.]